MFEIEGYGTLEGEPGDAWAFPSKTARHRVTEVTRGRRQSLVGWHHRLDGDGFTEPGWVEEPETEPAPVLPADPRPMIAIPRPAPLD